ncbi:MAG TPA: UbiA family prenyltransferase [Gemmatimonadales bacterium]|jgi:4-hydroxybenzoate polyprenyltransferase|nr:UbiA family prenyltransferase [Gemmatimonadales bacterium]
MTATEQRPTVPDKTLARHLARRVFGPVLPYVLHLRPAEWPIVAAHTAVGWLLAAGIHWPDGRAWLGIGAWVVALNGGTLALNSAFDRDEGDVAFLHDPPRPPPHLALFATVLMAAGLAATWQLSSGYRGLYVICFAMSVAYSVPPLRLKAIGGADWVINLLGFGTFSPAAAWAIERHSFGGPRALVLWAFAPLFAGLYPLTQIYQMDEDRARGDQTFALWLGRHNSLVVALICTGFGFGMLAMAGWEAGWRGGAGLLRWGALALAAAAWLATLGPWIAEGREWSSGQHQRAMYYALVAWALTDVVVLIGWASL